MINQSLEALFLRRAAALHGGARRQRLVRAGRRLLSAAPSRRGARLPLRVGGVFLLELLEAEREVERHPRPQPLLRLGVEDVRALLELEPRREAAVARQLRLEVRRLRLEAVDDGLVHGGQLGVGAHRVERRLREEVEPDTAMHDTAGLF